MKKITLVLFLFASLIVLNACSPNISPNTYVGSSVGVAAHVVPATVVSVRKVNIDNSSMVGGLTGATVGGAAGSAIGGSTNANIAGLAAGALVGGVIGNKLDKAVNTNIGYEYILRTDNKKLISVTQTEDLKLSVKQHVLIIYGDMVRIIPDK